MPPRMILLPAVAVTYGAIAVAAPSTTTGAAIYSRLVVLLGGDPGLSLYLAGILMLLMLGWLGHRLRVRVPALSAAFGAFVFLGVLLFLATPGALLPGFLLTAAACCGYALHDAVAWHGPERRS